MCKEERDNLITENINLVYHVLFRYFPSIAKNEDWRQEGMVGLIQAADSYNPKFGVTFSTYACTCIHNNLANQLSRKHNQLHDNEPLEDLDWKHPTNQDFTQMYVEEFINILNPRQREVLELRMSGYRQGVIGNLVGMSPQGVSNMLHRIGVLWNRYNTVRR